MKNKNFSQALRALKKGKRATRDGWCGYTMFVYLVSAASYLARTEIAKEHFGEGALVPYRAYLALKTEEGDIEVWSPTNSDILAEDWIILN